MEHTKIEPGLLRIFRWYALLRLVIVFFTVLFILRFARRSGLEDMHQISLPAALVIGEVAILIVYLYWSALEDRFGELYLPIGITIASIGLVLQAHIVSPTRIYWQPLPFLYILVIIVAWQYRFRDVVFYTIGMAILEFALIVLFRAHGLSGTPIGGTDRAVSFGMLFSRSITFLLVGYVVTRLMDAQRKQRRELAQANIKLVRHASALEQLTISRERNRVARELHDTLAHTLSALAVQIDALLGNWDDIPARARGMLEQMLDTTRSGLDETRRALSALRASPLEELGLGLALRSLGEDFAKRYDFQLTSDVSDDIRDVPPEVEQTFYRVAQEALENIARHAHAKQVELALNRVPGGLTLIVADDGLGFVFSDRIFETKHGLKGIKERADMIGARLNIESHPGDGARIELTWLEES